jgi:uncharacterized membrane protein YkvA (DUF1232 family)
MKFFKKIGELIQFIKNVAADPRIPSTDKKVLLALVALIISPFDIIPDWLPIIGQIDDAILFALVLDYLFSIDEQILLDHYPWSKASLDRLRKVSKAVAFFAPGFIKRRLWSYARPSSKSS